MTLWLDDAEAASITPLAEIDQDRLAVVLRPPTPVASPVPTGQDRTGSTIVQVEDGEPAKVEFEVQRRR